MINITGPVRQGLTKLLGLTGAGGNPVFDNESPARPVVPLHGWEQAEYIIPDKNMEFITADGAIFTTRAGGRYENKMVILWSLSFFLGAGAAAQDIEFYIGDANNRQKVIQFDTVTATRTQYWMCKRESLGDNVLTAGWNMSGGFSDGLKIPPGTEFGCTFSVGGALGLEVYPVGVALPPGTPI